MYRLSCNCAGKIEFPFSGIPAKCSESLAAAAARNNRLTMMGLIISCHEWVTFRKAGDKTSVKFPCAYTAPNGGFEPLRARDLAVHTGDRFGYARPGRNSSVTQYRWKTG
jgi:hypothetical protein